MPAARCESQAHGDMTFPQSNSMLWNGLGIQKIKLWNAQNICQTPVHFLVKFHAAETHTHTHWHNLPSLGAQNVAKSAGCCTLFVTTLENTNVTCHRKNLAVILVCLKIGQGPRIRWWIMFPSRWLVGWGIGWYWSTPFSGTAIFVKLVKFQRLPPSHILRHPLKSQWRKAAKCGKGSGSDTDPAQPSVGTNLVHHGVQCNLNTIWLFNIAMENHHFW